MCFVERDYRMLTDLEAWCNTAFTQVERSVYGRFIGGCGLVKKVICR